MRLSVPPVLPSSWALQRGHHRRPLVPRAATTVQVLHAPTRVWRPHLDDVDRLSRGEGARIRGTGCRDIPHRLNVEEHGAFKAAKKKGFLAVRGTGYRRERKGNPLPNVWRQWCDAKACVCIVIEQDLSGSSPDQIVVDLSTLRIMDTSRMAQVRHVCNELSTSMGVSALGPNEREAIHVPFNVLPLEGTSLSSSSSGGGGGSSGGGEPGSSGNSMHWGTTGSVGSPSNVIKAKHTRQRLQAGPRSSSAGGSSSSEAGRASSDGVSEGDLLADADEKEDLALQQRFAELQAQLVAQQATVRALKEGQGRENDDPEVQAQVAVLLQLKAAAALAEEEAAGAHASRVLRQRRGASARRAALYDAFEEGGDEDEGASAVAGLGAPAAAGSQQGQQQEQRRGEQDDGAVPDAAGSSDGQEDELGKRGETGSKHGWYEGGEDVALAPGSGDATAGLESQEQRMSLAALDARDGGGGGGGHHPYCRAAIWQLPADPLFFEADRATAKLFAKALTERVGSMV